MNPKSVAIIVVVAVVVAGISFGTFLMDSDDELELRDYLVVGDWVEYYNEGMDYTEMYTVEDVEAINSYYVNVSDEYSITTSYQYLFTTIDPDDDNVEYQGSETVNTFLGKTECDVYTKVNTFYEYVYFVEPNTNLVLITEGTNSEGHTFRTMITGTSVFDPVDLEFTEIAIAQPGAGSTFTHEVEYDYVSGDSFYYSSWGITVTVDSVNEDGTLNITDSEEPITVEQFMSKLRMTDEEIAASTLMGTKVVSTQWGIMECYVYVMPYQDPDSTDVGDRTFIVEPDTGIVLTTWIEMHDVEYMGQVWEDYRFESVLIDCNIVLVAD